ncbi:hypothetical protein [Nocardia salmonicida]|uniref:hypothetical protein n=1 Tax=Nocardia salmonicida TaxID=53431 RepID=UPI003409778C
MTENAHTLADQSPTETDTRPEVDCPIRVGDEVTGHNNRTWRGVVRNIYNDDGIVRCSIQTSTGGRGLATPWSLAPADEEPSAEWLDRMHAYRSAERDNALSRLRKVQREIAEEAQALAQQLTTIAATLRANRFYHPDNHDRLESEATEIDGGLAYLAETRHHLATSGLFTPTEILQHLAVD